MKDTQNKLYLIGGPARSGKTTILQKILRRKPICAVSSDSIREAARNIFVGESYISVDKLAFEGDATFRRPGEKISHQIHFNQHPTEDELTWQAITGFINSYDRKNREVLIEGVSITLKRILALKLQHLQIRAAFVGFTRDTHLKTIMAHSQKQNDWIQKVIQENDGDDSAVRTWFHKEVEENKQLKKAAEQHGYPFFDISAEPFETVTASVVDYLLS